MLIEGVLLAKFAYSIYFMFMGSFDPSTLPLPYYMVVPFDDTTIWGWYLLWFIQCVMSFNYSMGVISTTSYFLCCCIYIDTMQKHIALLFATLKDNVDQIKNLKRQTAYRKLRQDIQGYLHQAIDLHVHILE